MQEKEPPMASQETRMAIDAEPTANPHRPGYPFRSRFLELPAGRMHYLDEGEARGAPLLFVHGTPTWSYEWRHLIRDLSRTHRCVAPDHLGFGLSDRPRSFSYRPEAHAENLAAFARRLELKDITLVVHSIDTPISPSGCSRLMPTGTGAG